MNKIKYDLDEYSHSELCDMFDLNKNEINSTTLNQNYNRMLTEINGERGIPDSDKEKLYAFLEKAFKKLLERDNDYKLTEGDFMPDLEKNKIFSNNNPVIKKEIQKDLNEVVNPLKTKTLTKFLNINTLFRKNYYGQSSTDFIIDLPDTIKNVSSITLLTTQIPNNMYTFSSKNKTNQFTVETYESTTVNGTPVNKKKYIIKVKNGNYDVEELVNYLNTYVFSPDNAGNTDLRRVAVTYDKITKKIIFFRDQRTTAEGGLPDDAGNKYYYFNLDWNISGENRAIQLNMGWILGFRKEYYSYINDYTTKNMVSDEKQEGFVADACYEHTSGQKYIFLSIDDYNNNFSKSIISPFEDSTINDNNIFAKLNNNGETFNYGGPSGLELIYCRKYFGPINLMKLRIRLLDEFGRVIDLNNSDYTFTLKIEQIYDSMAN